MSQTKILVLLAGVLLLLLGLAKLLQRDPILVPAPEVTRIASAEERPQGIIDSWRAVNDMIAWLANVKEAVNKQGYVTLKVQLPSDRELEEVLTRAAKIQAANTPTIAKPATPRFPDDYGRCLLVFVDDSSAGAKAARVAGRLYAENLPVYKIQGSHPGLVRRYGIHTRPWYVVVEQGRVVFQGGSETAEAVLRYQLMR